MIKQPTCSLKDARERDVKCRKNIILSAISYLSSRLESHSADIHFTLFIFYRYYIMPSSCLFVINNSQRLIIISSVHLHLTTTSDRCR